MEEIIEIQQMIHIVYMVCFFIIGTLFGSFFTLATYRIPRKQDIVFKRSYCTNCKHELGFFDLFPILSYVFLRGKCRYCKEKISIRYPLFELANGIFFLISYLIFGMSWILFATLIIYIFLFIVVGTNIMKKKMNEEKINDKKGVFNIEILVAIFAFIIYYIATIYTTRNYSETLKLAKLRSDAMNVALNVMEENKAKDYEKVENIINEKVTVDEYTYLYNLNVEEYHSVIDDSVDTKKINVSVVYEYDGKSYDVTFQTVIFEE